MPADPRTSGKRATIRDVARLAGVNPSTVSRVLNGDDRRAIAPTRELIRKAAADLDWRPNSVARSLSTGRMYALGFMIPSLQNPAYAAMISGAERAADEHGNVVLLTDAADETRALRQVDQLTGRVDGLVVASARKNSRVFDLLTTRGVPFVLLNRRAQEGLPAVIGDDEEGVRLAIEHLVSLGHTRIAQIRGPRGIDTADRRAAAFNASLRRAGLKSHMNLLASTDMSEAGGLDAMETFLALPKESRPSALFCVNLLVAVGAVARARQAGIDVPSELSVVGFDDWPLADRLAVPLTTVRMPSADMGAAAIDLLQRRIDGEVVAGDHRVTTSPELIVRSSTSAPGTVQ